MTGVLIKRGNLEADRQGKQHVKMKPGMGVMLPQAKECQTASNPPEARREAWSIFLLTAPRRNQPCPHLDLGTSRLQDCERLTLLFKPPSLRYFDRAALGD